MKCRFVYLLLWAEGCDWRNDDTIFAGVRKFADRSEHHQERGCFHLVGVNLRCECLKAFRTLIYSCVTSKLDFYESVFAASEVHNGITLQSIFVAIVIHRATESIGIAAQVTHRHCLE